MKTNVKFKRSLMAIICFLAISFSLTASASNYYSILPWPAVKFSTGQYQLTYSYSLDGSATVNWSDSIASGMAAWNSSLARVYIGKTTGGANIEIKSGNYGNTGWDGDTEYPNFWGHPNTAYMKLNDYTISYSSGGHEDELVAHETGHALKLDDYDPSYETLMRSSGYNGNPYPTDSDVTGVNVTY